MDSASPYGVSIRGQDRSEQYVTARHNVLLCPKPSTPTACTCACACRPIAWTPWPPNCATPRAIARASGTMADGRRFGRHRENRAGQGQGRQPARPVALRAAPARLVPRVVAGLVRLVGGDARAARRGARDDRRRLPQREQHRRDVRVAVRRDRRARTGDGGALLFRLAAGRTRRRGPAATPVQPPARSRPCVLRSHAQWRTRLAPVGRHRIAAQPGGLQHFRRAAQLPHGARQHRDDVRHQPAAGDLHHGRHPAVRRAHRDRQPAPAEDVAPEPGSRGRCERARQRSARQRAHGAIACARTLRARALRRRRRARRRHRAPPHRHAGDRHGGRDHRVLRRDHHRAVVRRARCGGRAHERGHARAVRVVRDARRRFGRRARRSLERRAARGRRHGAHQRSADGTRVAGRARASDAVAAALARRHPPRRRRLPLSLARGCTGARRLLAARAPRRNGGARRSLRRGQEHGVRAAAALPRSATRQHRDRRYRPAPARPRAPARIDRARPAGSRRSSRRPPATTSATAGWKPATPTSSKPRARPKRTSSSTPCRRNTRANSANAARACPAASSNASPSRAPC